MQELIIDAKVLSDVLRASNDVLISLENYRDEFALIEGDEVGEKRLARIEESIVHTGLQIRGLVIELCNRVDEIHNKLGLGE
ncbi:hypothetical protein JDS99_28410 [Bacillus cereus group sp. N6]|uniref:hypothetical protein n=1 Tax=Bacillus cereus group sp. N6 TaxID=2794583 RepID=UPI0018F34874|nr:hypothetical protein [Bacillus cereus group sp. N6]MBJ8113476.1 hypothetical protein [Bacillus cereus group sp. N6]